MRRKKSEGNTRRPNASKLKVGIALARFNGDITEELLAAAQEELRAWKVKEKNIRIVRVAGSFELPIACQRLIKKRNVDVVVALGCIVKGETDHDGYLAEAVFNALQRLSLKYDRPVGLGILTVNTLAQAKKRIDYGSAAASAALEVALL